MKNKTGWRISISFLLFFSIVFLPFGVSVAIGLFGVMYFPVYWEAVLLFLLSDLLFGAPSAEYVGFTYVSSLASVVFLMVAEYAKKILQWHN